MKKKIITSDNIYFSDRVPIEIQDEYIDILEDWCYLYLDREDVKKLYISGADYVLPYILFHVFFNDNHKNGENACDILLKLPILMEKEN